MVDRNEGSSEEVRLSSARRWALRAHALFLGVAGLAGMLFDFRGVFFGLGPQGRILANAPHAGIGFVEAHGLALILAVVLWRGPAKRSLHLVGTAIALLLGISNVIFWEMFVHSDSLTVGYVTTGLHAFFAAGQLTMAFPRIASNSETNAGRSPA